MAIYFSLLCSIRSFKWSYSSRRLWLLIEQPLHFYPTTEYQRDTDDAADKLREGFHRANTGVLAPCS